VRPIITTLVSFLALASAGPVKADSPSLVAERPTPNRVRAFVAGGTGFFEIAHVELGAFVTQHLSLEAQGSYMGVFGGMYGLGASYLIGPVAGARPPRHALLLGGRVMTGPDLSLNSHGDTLASFAMLRVGYSFMNERGFMFRLEAGPVATWDRGPSEANGSLAIGGPLATAAVGYAF
jgi:hypothetical protein